MPRTPNPQAIHHAYLLAHHALQSALDRRLLAERRFSRAKRESKGRHHTRTIHLRQAAAARFAARNATYTAAASFLNAEADFVRHGSELSMLHETALLERSEVREGRADGDACCEREVRGRDAGLGPLSPVAQLFEEEEEEEVIAWRARMFGMGRG
jgi:hypothetical protein